MIRQIFKVMQVQLESESNEPHEQIISALALYIFRNKAQGDLTTLKESIKGFLTQNSSININKQFTTTPKNESLFIKQIKKTIAEYEALIKEKQGEDVTEILHFKALLVDQLHKAELELAKSQKLGKSKEDKALYEIFSFYCKQQLLIGNKPTFEQLENVSKNMNLAEFMKLCKDFAIALPPLRVREIFKKTARFSKYLDWELFLTLLEKIAFEVVEYKIAELEKQLKKEQNPISSNEIEELKSQSAEKRLEELYKFMEISKPAKYKKKMSAMILPFNIREKDSRIPLDGLNKLPKHKMHRKVSHLNDQQVRVKQSIDRSRHKEIPKISKVENERVSKELRAHNERMGAKKRIVAHNSYGGYNYIGNKKEDVREMKNQYVANIGTGNNENNIIEESKQIKRRTTAKQIVNIKVSPKKNQTREITWELLKHLSYNDVNGFNLGEGDFKPEDFIVSDDPNEAAKHFQDIYQHEVLNKNPYSLREYGLPRDSFRTKGMKMGDEYLYEVGNDGLPSAKNVKGGYDKRMMLNRAQQIEEEENARLNLVLVIVISQSYAKILNMQNKQLMKGMNVSNKNKNHS